MNDERKIKGLEKVERLYEDRSTRVKELQKQGKKIMGYFCCAPLEILTAADVIPYRVTGDMNLPVTKADGHLETITCPFVRSAFDIAIKGGYDFFDGFVMPHGCDSTQCSYELWDYHTKPAYSRFINVPHTTTPSSVVFCKEEFHGFKKSLERFIGDDISDEKLKEAIRLHNDSRALVRQLYETRKSDPPLISSGKVIKVIRAIKSLPVEEGNTLLKQVIDEVKAGDHVTEKKSARLMIYGAEIDDPVLLDMIESKNAHVVVDDICMGLRTYLRDVKVTEDPLDGLVSHYLKDITCPRTWSPRTGSREEELKERFSYLADLARAWSVDGVIVFVIRYCDNFAFDAPDVKDYLKSCGLEVMHIETDYCVALAGQLGTRFQAFVEMLSSST